MTHAADLPLWLALPISLLLLLGAGLALTGSLGLLRLRSFYDRMHAPTLGTTLGVASVLLASMLLFSVLQTRLVLHEVLIAAVMVVTTPMTLLLLARAALYRDRSEGSPEVPHRPSGALASRRETGTDRAQPGQGSHPGERSDVSPPCSNFPASKRQ